MSPSFSLLICLSNSVLCLPVFLSRRLSTILEKIKVQDVLSYLSFDIHDLI